jgi:SOS-response transcriptional repressor LexA
MNPQMTRLYQAAKDLQGISGQAALARALGASSQTLHNWELRGMSKQGLVLAQRVIGCSASWLETGAGPVSIAGATNVGPATVGARPIPLISYVQAGAWTDVVDSYQPGDADEFLLTDMELSSNAFALEIKGDSMLPEFKPGDRVIIDPVVCPQPGDYVVAKNGEDEATFKKYRPRGVNEHGDVVFELVPLNEDYPSMRSDVTPIRIVGTMVEHRKYRKRG